MENEDKKDFAGKNGFIWWTGVVEDRLDPLKLGRCRVRCVGWHSENKAHLPTNMLPWAIPSHPVNHHHTYAPKDGDMVFGFFADGENAQTPIMLGVFPNIPLKAANPQEAFSDCRTEEQLKNSPRTPQSKQYRTDGSGIAITEKQKAELHPRELDEPTTSRIARNESEYIVNTFIQERKATVVNNIPTFNSRWSEPPTQYSAKYPFNNVMETESGHIQEFDDTPGSERIHLAHRNGSFQEWYPNGDKVEKVTKNNYEIIMADDNVYIMGKCNITVQGDAQIYVRKDAYLKVDGNANWRINRNLNVTVAGTYNLNVGNKNETIKNVSHIRYNGDSYTWVGGDTYSVRQSGKTDHSCPTTRFGRTSCPEVRTAQEVE
jgi:hypothetical protein